MEVSPECRPSAQVGHPGLRFRGHLMSKLNWLIVHSLLADENSVFPLDHPHFGWSWIELDLRGHKSGTTPYFEPISGKCKSAGKPRQELVLGGAPGRNRRRLPSSAVV